jgi:uncharacterized YccA/Bax inhibitor family protein
MQSRNPVLSRIGQEQTTQSGSGFAYNEGVDAYRRAGVTTVAQPGHQAGPPAYAPPQAGERLTINDVIIKTAICFVVLLAGAVVGWQLTPQAPWVMWVSMVVAMGLAFANIFRREASPALVLAYSLAEGFFLGGISYWYNEWVATVNPDYTGLIGQAIVGTFVAFAVMLALYQTRIVKVNGTFVKVMMVALVSYAVIAVASLIAALFGVGGGWGFYGMGGLGIALMAFAIVLAAFSLMLDFEAIKQGIAMGMPERESWRMAFGLLVTLVWLYLEILRLLAILAASRD